MKRLSISLVLAGLVSALAAAPAPAAATRAEYIAQIEPICLAANQEEKREARRIARKLKRFLAELQDRINQGKPIKEIADLPIVLVVKLERSRNAIFERTTAQIAAVPPAPGDELVVATWLAGRAEYVAIAGAAIRAAKHLKPSRFLGLFERSIDALRRAQEPVQTFGLNHCFVELPVL